MKSSGLRQYLRPENYNQKYLDATKQILSGNISDPWIDRFNKKLFCKERLIKDIRINMLIDWITTHFPKTNII